MEQHTTKLPSWHKSAVDLIRKYGGTSPQSDCCDRGSDRRMCDWNEERHPGVGTASRNSRFHQGFNKENNSRTCYSRSRSPCQNFLNGRCHFGASCKRLHPVNTYKHNWSAEQHPMVAGYFNNHAFADEPSALSSRKHRRIYLRTGSFSREQYFRRGSCYQGANLRPVTVYEKRNYDMGSQHHQGVAVMSRDHTGNVVKQVNCHGVRPYQDTHAGCNVSLNEEALSTKENINVDSSGWSSERKRSRPASDFGGNQQQPEVCLKFTKGRCDQEGNYRYLHNFHEYASSISQQCQKPHLKASEDLMNIGQTNQCADIMAVHTHDTSRDDKMQSNEREHPEGNLSFLDKKTMRKSVDDVVTPNTVNQNAVELATGGCRLRNPAQGTEIVNLWSRPFKRRRSSPKENVRCETLRRDGNGKVVASHGSKKNEVQSATNAVRCNHADENSMELVTDCITAEKPLESDSTSFFEKHLISEMNTAAVGLGKCETTGVKLDLNHELNENTEKSEHMVKVYSRKKRIKQHPSTCKCDTEPMMEQVTDTKSQNLTISSSVGWAPLDHKNGDTERHCGKTLLPILKSKRKLLVLDVNGLLVDIVANFPDTCKPDTTVGGKGVFKRPFCDDFMQFCFEKFDVGIWSSRTKKNVTMVLDCLMEKTKDKLLFCWHQSHCTQTGYNTFENKDKPLVLKELKKLWEKAEDDLPWKKGFYDETNTILLDDSPHKALRNPPCTAVFPCPYTFNNVKDKSLGPDGDLHLYLERLAEAENVQKFIQENPFGQKPITKTNVSWTFYSKIAGEYTRQQDVFASSSSNFSKHHHACK